MNEHFIHLSLSTIEVCLDRRLQIFTYFTESDKSYIKRLEREKNRHRFIKNLIIFHRTLIDLSFNKGKENETPHLKERINQNRGLIDRYLNKLVPRLPLVETDDSFGHIPSCDQCLGELLLREDQYKNLTDKSDLIYLNDGQPTQAVHSNKHPENSL